MNEPKLRFKADDGSTFPDWEEKKLEDVVEFLDGQRKPLEAGKRVAGEYPYYGASGIIDYVDNYIFDEELILLSEDGANILDRNYRVCFLARGKYWVNNHAHVLRAMSGNVNGFLCEQLESFDYRKYNSGSAQPKLNQETCRSIIVNVPSLPEQQKIADFLSTIDTVIEKQKATVEAWEERKKGVMQKLFSQEVRFKADDGSEFPDWKEKKLGDVFVEQTERAKGGEALLSVTIAQGIVRQSETDKRNIASENKSNYKVVKKNDLAYNTMRMWQGAEGVSEYDGIVSPAYTVVTALDGNNSYFFETIFKQKFMLQMFQRYSQGLTSDTWNLKFPAFSEIKCFVPCEDEQNKIVECVHVFDDVIEKQKATLAAWEEMKKGLLQQMFV